jgi:acetylornithine deacetylase/succinyl-diaminopimelate desuccinylase-like protein
MNPLENLKQYYQKEKTLKEFFEFLRFQSISTDLAYKPQAFDCARWLSDYIRNIGFDVELWQTPGNPVIFASNLKAGFEKPTLLIYNHYDVQPVDPLSEWHTSPFEPSEREGEIYARGAQDNKGQCFYVLQALKMLMEKHGRLPINIKLCIEGEEESGSSGLAKLLKEEKYRKQLKANSVAIVDMGLSDKTVPAVTLGVRGLVTMEIQVKGSKTDLHSGSHGGIVFNPLHALASILSKLRDEDGRVKVPGFYDDIVPLDPKEKEFIAWAFNSDKYEEFFGAKAVGGERQYQPLERAWNRPTIEINGIHGGYGGAGFKTVIPARAIAKVSCRLVPNQDPQKIGSLVADFIKKEAPEGVDVQVELFPGMGKAIRANPSSLVVQAFSKAYEELFGKPCQKIFDGGSIPIVTELAHAAEGDVILLGFGLPDDQIHAPNEHFGIDRMEMGALVVARAIELYYH